MTWILPKYNFIIVTFIWAAHYSIIISILYIHIVLWYSVEWLRNKVKVYVKQNNFQIYLSAQIKQIVPVLVINAYLL